MQTSSLEDVLDQILEKDKRYHKEAYLFLREALEHTQKTIGRKRKEIRHITGQELLEGIREFALEAFGPMSLDVLADWGLHSCEDFGQMVFLMVDHNLLRKTEQDSIEDFKNGYDFEEAFRKPFLPANKAGAAKCEPERAGVEKH